MIRLSEPLGLSAEFTGVAGYIVLINVLLACFNIIPIPPLDGSKVIIPFLPFGLQQKYRAFGMYLERLGFVSLFFLIFIFMLILQKPFFMLVAFVQQVLIGG